MDPVSGRRLPDTDGKPSSIGEAIRAGDVANAERRWADAEAAYLHALDGDSSLAHIWVQYGHAVKEQGDLKRAEAAYRQSIALNHASADTHVQLGHALKLQGRIDDARTAYATALRLDADCQPAARELQALRSSADKPAPEETGKSAGDWVRMGDAANAARRWDEAERAYAQALKCNPGLGAIWVQYGHALKEQGALDRAEQAYRGALALQPADGDTYLQLGHLLKLSGRRKAAIAAYEGALAHSATQAAARYELSRLGVAEHLARSFEERLRDGSTDLIPVIANEIVRLREALERIAALLPDASAQSAFPLALYDRFREIYRTPAPPRAETVPIEVILLVDGLPLEGLWQQVHALIGQSFHQFTVQALGRDPGARRVVGGLQPAEPRLQMADSPPSGSLVTAIGGIASVPGSDWMLLPAKGAVLDRQALAWFAVAATIPGCAAAWTCDEEMAAPEGPDRGAATLTPDLGQVVDYDWLLDIGARGRTLMIRREVLRQAALEAPGLSPGALRTALLLDLAREGRVGHVPLPLACRRSADQEEGADHLATLAAHLARHHLAGRVELAPDAGSSLPLPVIWRPPAPLALTVIIATRDNVTDVTTLIDGMRGLAAEPGTVDFFVIDNGSSLPASAEMLEQLSGAADVQVVRMDEPFNWSRLNNRAASLVTTPLLVFANDDMVMLTPGWDARLRGLLAREEVGIVGAKLLYPDDTNQHAGMLFDWRGTTIHDGLCEPAEAAGPQHRWQVTRAAGAVTGAFLATRRELFLETGGFDEVCLPVAQSDVDYALKIRQRGLKVLWTPRIVLYHFESKSRGLDHLDAERQARGQAELAALRQRWGQALDQEPSMNPAYQRATLPFRLIASPALSRIMGYMALSASGDPWRPQTDTSGAG